jgi:hypothetical protein
VVEGLLAAAEMAEFMADRKEHEALRLEQLNKKNEAKISREVEAELRKLATSLRSRAGESTTGEFIRVGEGTEVGWAPRKRRKTTGANDTAVTVIDGLKRKRRRRKTWLSKLAFWR